MGDESDRETHAARLEVPACEEAPNKSCCGMEKREAPRQLVLEDERAACLWIRVAAHYAHNAFYRSRQGRDKVRATKAVRERDVICRHNSGSSVAGQR